ncbi:BRO-N domain-containing protein [Azospirillum argentinense]
MHDWPTPGFLCVSESGVYKLVMRSDRPEARKFRDWVSRDVLPSLRKNGG